MKKLLIVCAGFIVVFVFSMSQSHAGSKEDIKAACPNGVKSESALVKKVVHKQEKEKDSSYTEFEMRVVDTTRQCYKLSSTKFVYLVDEKHAIYRVYIDYYSKPLLLLDFVNSKVKYKLFGGIVKGAGEFEYKDRQGIPRKIPRVLVVYENKR